MACFLLFILLCVFLLPFVVFVLRCSLVSDCLRLDHRLVGSIASRCMVPFLVMRYVRWSASVRFFTGYWWL